jgi:perosamine synthetase
MDTSFTECSQKKYTEAFVNYLGDKEGYADAVCTGTAALYVAISALQLEEGSEVIVSPITDPGTLNAIILNRLVPVLADSMPNSYNIGKEQFEKQITSKTKAVVVVHSAGQAAPIDEISELARNRNILVVEDCSQAHGAVLKNKKVGTFGTISAFSTMYRKAHATGGAGGVVYTRSAEMYRLVRAYSDRGKPFWREGYDEKDPTQFMFPALNFHLDEISCAVGFTSLKKLNSTIMKRLAFLQSFSKGLIKNSMVCKPYPISEDDSPFFFPVFVKESAISCSVYEFAKAVQHEGVGLNPKYMYVVSEWPWIQSYLGKKPVTPNALMCRNNSFNLFVNENYGELEVNSLVNAILKVEKYYSK